MKPYEERIEGFVKQIKEWIDSIYKQGYKDGYDKCKAEMQKCEVSQDEVYKAGHADGYDAGYSEGYMDGQQYESSRSCEEMQKLREELNNTHNVDKQNLTKTGRLFEGLAILLSEYENSQNDPKE